jgi:hypothetical protein
MKYICIYFSVGILLFPSLAMAQLAVTVSSPQILAQKAVITLKMRNGLAEKIESARAICFLLDDQGKMVGESAKWVIGGTKNRPALAPKQAASFNFVITSPQPFMATNITAKVSFTRLILEGGKSVNPNKEVTIEQQLLSTTQISPTNNPVVSKPLDSVIASVSSPITVRPPPQTASTVMVTNLLRPVNLPQK